MRALRPVLAVLLLACANAPPAPPPAPVPPPASKASPAMPTFGASAPADVPDPFGKLAPPKLPEKKVDPAAALQLGPVPPPQPTDVALPFPPPEAPDAPVPEVRLPPLAVLRALPEGLQELVGTVTVTFNQPMVALSAVKDVNAGPVPLVLDPQPPGKFRWMDVSTLAFDAAPRLPIATTFKARVPAGTRSAGGQVLGREHAWTFETAKPALVRADPWEGNEGLRPDAVFVLAFNGRMDPALAKGHVTLLAKGRPVDVELAARKVDFQDVPAERLIEVRPRAPLPLDSDLLLRLSDKLRSAEGPNPAGAVRELRYRTYGPLRLERVECGECDPDNGISVQFNNAIAYDGEPSSFISIAPVPPNVVISGGGSWFAINGDFEPKRTYTVTVAARTKDVHGQVLGRAEQRSITMGTPRPDWSLQGEGRFVLLEAAKKKGLSVEAASLAKLNVRVGKVDPRAIGKLWKRVVLGAGDDETVFGEGVTEASRRDVAFDSDGVKKASIDLREALGSGGHGLAVVEVNGPKLKESWRPTRRAALVQVTDLALNAVFDHARLFAYVSTLAGGAAVEGATVELMDIAGTVLASARSDAAGVVMFDVPALPHDRRPVILSAASPIDRVVHFIDSVPDSPKESKTPRFAGALFFDRGVHRPGEELHANVVVRRVTSGAAGDLEGAAGLRIGWSLSNGEKDVAEGEGVLSRFGTLAIAWKIPAEARLGRWWMRVRTEHGQVAGGDFRVEEFRVPEFAVDVEAKIDGTPFIGKPASFLVAGRYLFGAPMSGAEFEWRLTRTEAKYAPKGWPGFEFGWEPVRWGHHHRWDRDEEDTVASGRGKLDGEGRSTLTQVLEPSGHGPATYALAATVYDANRQAVGGATSVLAHRASIYAGVRVPSRVVGTGESITPDAVAVDLAGRPQKGVAVALDFVSEDGDAESASRCEVKAGNEPVSCSLRAPAKAGAYRVRATAKDADGRVNEASVRVWVVGGASAAEGSAPTVRILADRESYEAGATARLTLSTSFARGRGWLVLGREGVMEIKPIRVENATAALDVKVREEWMPGIHCQAVIDTSEDAGSPRYATAELVLAVDRATRQIAVDVKPSATVAAPGSELTIDLHTRDRAGRAVPANVALMVVDEGVLSLTGFKTPELLEQLYAQARASGLRAENTRELLREEQQHEGASGLARSKRKMAAAESMMEREMPAPSPPGGRGGEGGPDFDVRTVFATAAFFDGAVETDADGRARRTFKLPDNLTEFRVMAVAADVARLFGTGESSVTVRKPVLVRPSLPRFVNVGDAFEAAAVVHNDTGADADFEVLLRAANATVEGERQRIALKNGEKREVRFRAAAGVPGPAKFQFAAVALTAAHPTDAAEIVIPTLIPATAEAFATYGSTLDAEKMPLAPPKDALPGWGGLELQLSSTALTGLSDAVSYLVEYPYECAEQTASRLIPLTVLKPLFWQFGIAAATDEFTRRRYVRTAIERLLTLQRSDGGFAFWAGSERAQLYLTGWVLHALERAKASGAEVDPYALERASNWLRDRLGKAPARDDWDDTPSARAFAALVLVRRGVDVRAEIERLAQLELPIFATAWMWEAGFRARLADARLEPLRRRIANAAVESAGAIHFAERRSEALSLLMHSDDRTDAIVLQALLAVAPRDSMVEKLARGVMRSRVKGRWSTTQANAFALEALQDYFDVYEQETPAFDARVWVAGRYVAGRRFEGREFAQANTTVPLAALAPGDLVVAKSGAGRLYWRAGLRYALAAPQKLPESQGFHVERTYEAVSPADGVTREPDGRWRVKAGATVRVRVTVTTPDRRHYVAVVDPMPAGFESVDPNLAASAKVAPDERSHGWWWSPWTHTELRDDRVQLFADALPAGVFHHAYVARATSIGTFVASPTRAEEMYAPETFGRSAADVVVIAE